MLVVCASLCVYFQGGHRIEFPIGDSKVGLVIGRRGATINDLQDRHRVNVQIPQQADESGNRIITVSGPPAGCEACKAEILNICSNDQRGGSGTHCCCVLLKHATKLLTKKYSITLLLCG